MRLVLSIVFVLLLSGACQHGVRLPSRVASCYGKDACVAEPAFAELLTTLGMPTGPSFDDVVVATRAWMRPADRERWQMPEKYTELRPKLMLLFTKMGLTEERKAAHKFYDYAILHGSTLQSFRKRVASFLTAWGEGVRFKEVAVLSGFRRLDEKLEVQVLKDEISVNTRLKDVALPTNEFEMLHYVWDQTEMPAAIRELPIVWINAAPAGMRAHTAGAVNRWLENHPHPGSILAFSNQPYVEYQDLRLRSRVPSSFKVETIGAEASDGVMNVTYLNTIAQIVEQLAPTVLLNPTQAE